MSGAGIEVVVKRLDASPEAVRALHGALSHTEQQRAQRYRAERDRRRFIAARAHLRQLLAERLGVGPEAVELVYGRNGKPGLAFSDWRFNVSHCDDVAVFAFTRGHDLGIDIEAVRAVPEGERIAARFFSSAENAVYRALEPHEKAQAFFNCWTRKEAFVKALGDGLSMPLDRFDVTLAPGEPARLLRFGDLPGEDAGWRLESFSPLPGFVAAVASRIGSFR
jgi:4'-phosphopantetheinyl transferase